MSLIHQLLVYPCICGTAFILLVDWWHTEVLCAETVHSPYLLCYVWNNFKAPQVILYRAIKEAGILKQPERFWPFLMLFKFNVSLLDILQSIFWAPAIFWCFLLLFPQPHISRGNFTIPLLFLNAFPPLDYFSIAINSDFFCLKSSGLASLNLFAPRLVLTLTPGLAV